jgi:hypothetical protein
LADDLLAKINEGMKKKEGASSSFNLAYEQFNAGNYEASQRSAEQAYKTYIEINYSIGIQESKVILDKASDKVAEDNAKQRTIFLSALVVVIFVATLVLNYLRKKKEMDEAARIADEERRKRDEMEKKKWDVRKDIEAERLAEEKFKEMIAEERDLISDKKPKNDDDLKEDVL